MRFNKLLGLGTVETSLLIEGAETRMLEDRNASMTTATESLDMSEYRPDQVATADGDEMQLVETTIRGRATMPVSQQSPYKDVNLNDEAAEEAREDVLSEYSMLDTVDRQLLQNIEQYVLQNMSRGQLSLEEMATAMGMGRVPFFHKVRNLTGKTPTELVRDLRLKHACILLKRTNINMSELATNVGFMTAENFITVFKEKFGLSPLEYRLKHRK